MSASNAFCSTQDAAGLSTDSATDTEGYILVDIGANLTNKKFSRDLHSVVQRAKDVGVYKIIVTGTSVQASKDALRLSRLFPGTLYSTSGVHPHDAKAWDDDSCATLQDFLSNSECVAVGECGLDFNRNFSPPDVQIEVFEKQVEIACARKKPLFVHEREAHTELLQVLKKYQDKLPAVVIHCFTGSKDEASTYLQMGFYIGLTGYLWKDKSENGIRKVLEDGVIPLDRLMLETDSPFMYPNYRASRLPSGIRSSLTSRSLSSLQRYCSFQRNEPCSLAVTAEMVSACMGQTVEQVTLTTTYNALKIFDISS